MSSVISAIGGRGNDAGYNQGNVNQASNQLSQNAAENQARASEQYQWGSEIGDEILNIARTASGRDFQLSDEAMTNARDLWARYRNVFRPVEDRVVKDASEYDSPEQMARVRQEAAGNANSAFDTAQASKNISMMRMGINPNSGRFVDTTASDIGRVAATADTMNRATADRQDRAMMLRQGVAQFGTGVASMGDRASEIALAATGAGTGVMNAAGGVASGLRTAPSAWAGASTQAAGGVGSLEIGRFNAGTSAAAVDEQVHHNFNVDAQNWTKMAVSDKNLKEDRKPVDDERILKDLLKLPNESWKYKDGVADSGRHIGPMAQAVAARFGVKAAPKGTTIDLVTMNGLLLSGVKALAKRTEKRERAHG